MSDFSLEIDSPVVQPQANIDDMYEYEHQRDLSVEEYFQNID